MKVGLLRLLLLVTATSLALTCGCTARNEDELSYGRPLASIVQPPPASPQPADKGQPGSWEKAPGVEPAGRLFVVGPENQNASLHPLVLVPSRWGVSPEIRDQARRLAEAGFLVAVPDLFDGVEPRHRLAVEELQKGVAERRALALLDAAARRLREDPRSDDRGVALFGSAVGGYWAYTWARRHAEDVAAVALDSTLLEWTPDALAGCRAPVLLLVGGASGVFHRAQRQAIAEAFEAAGVTARVEAIEGAGTDLFDPRANGWSEDAQGRAFKVLTAFLRGE
ncbi:MAG: dienelactone hydrolase family protein [Acidobacteriota bacterium]|nr:dienelactone hydrolase family protein [Acidobacteriota bacterium]MDQ7088122.1 dienelactone hydrolase family protein [Acidobacteriota bacterium]